MSTDLFILLYQRDSDETSNMSNGSTLRIIIYINISTGIAFTKKLGLPLAIIDNSFKTIKIKNKTFVYISNAGKKIPSIVAGGGRPTLQQH